MARYSRRKFMAAGAALAAAPLMARGVPGELGKTPETVRAMVSLCIGGRGIALDRWQIMVSPGDIIEWVFKGHSFGVHFLGVSPVEKISLQAKESVSVRVPDKNSMLGHFGYILAAFDEGMVWTIHADIIICPRPCPCPK